MADGFIDYYEYLGVPPETTSADLEVKLREFVVSLSSRPKEEVDPQELKILQDAAEIFSSMELKAEYDVVRKRQQVSGSSGEEEPRADAESFAKDAQDRHELLLRFYHKRRATMKDPGMGTGSLEQDVPYPKNVLEFHLWYFRERGWVERLEGGQVAITSKGVDKIQEYIYRDKETAAT